MFLALETEHFSVYREVGLPPACDTLGEELEAYFRTFTDYLGVDIPPGRKLTYLHFDRFARAQSACDGFLGCYLAESDTIVSVHALFAHEIAHAFETRIGGPGLGPTFFSEGLATALGGGGSLSRADRRVDASFAIEDLVDNDQFQKLRRETGGTSLYATAAGFVRFLVDAFGKSQFLTFYASVDGLGSGTRIKEKFLEAYGVRFDDTVQTWRARVQPLVDDLTLATPACELPAAIGAGDKIDVDTQCAFGRVRFDVPESGRLDLVVENAGDGHPKVYFFSCDHGSVVPDSMIVPPVPIRIALDVPPGAYQAIVDRAPATVSIAADTVTLDRDGACTPNRVPASIGNGQFAVVRRWGSLERQIAFDVQADSAGFLSLKSISGVGPLDPQGTTARTFYSCPDACTANLDQDCGRDDTIDLQSGVDTVRDVVGRPLGAKDLLHFVSGPRFGYAYDWSYSARLSVAPSP